MNPSTGLPSAYGLTGSSSFVDFLAALHPDRLPVPSASGSSPTTPHGTTIVALRTADGVVMAGDRRATMGNLIAQHDIEKVFMADDLSVIGIAGTAGLAVELVRLYQVEPAAADDVAHSLGKGAIPIHPPKGQTFICWVHNFDVSPWGFGRRLVPGARQQGQFHILRLCQRRQCPFDKALGAAKWVVALARYGQLHG